MFQTVIISEWNVQSERLEDFIDKGRKFFVNCKVNSIPNIKSDAPPSPFIPVSED